MVEGLPGPVNPYHPEADDDRSNRAPFVGRQKAFERIYQQLTDPLKAETTTILGRHQVGKTALLQNFDAFFDDSFVGVYVPLRRLRTETFDTLLAFLASQISMVLAERGFTLARLPENPPATGVQGWFEEEYLPAALNAIRRHRRLVLLLDDADALLNLLPSAQAGLSALYALVTGHQQFGIVLTLDTVYESQLTAFGPLVTLTSVFRLTNLSADESARLMQAPAEGWYTVTDESAAAVHRATGGHPRLLQRFGYHLFRRWEENRARGLLTPEDVQSVTPAVMAASSGGFRDMWLALNQNERLVLTAVASLLYTDPLAPITTEVIAAWLVETDYLLDVTAINAAIRSLEYRDVLTAPPVQIEGGLLQTWLLDNARLSPGPRPADGSTDDRPFDRRLAAAAVFLAVVLVLLVLALTSTPQDAVPTPPQPTVTLATPAG